MALGRSGFCPPPREIAVEKRLVIQQTAFQRIMHTLVSGTRVCRGWAATARSMLGRDMYNGGNPENNCGASSTVNNERPGGGWEICFAE